MSTRAARGIMREAKRKGGPIKISDDEAPVIYASRIVRKKHEIDSLETSALKVEISDLKAERDRYKNICFNGGSKALIEALTLENNKLLKKVSDGKLLKEKDDKIKFLIQEMDNIKNDLVLHQGLVDEQRRIIKEMSQINISLRIKVTELERNSLSKQVDIWDKELNKNEH